MELIGESGSDTARNSVELNKLAQQRERAWLSAHTKHEYEQHDLIAEMEEELADLLNYARAEFKQIVPISTNIVFMSVLFNHIDKAWEALQQYKKAKHEG